MTRATIGGLLGLVAVLTPAPALAQTDDEEVAARMARGRSAFENNCRICHSEELTTGLRLAPAQWKAEVTKMIGWGAPVPADEVEPLTVYLASTFGPDAPKSPPMRVAPAELAADVTPAQPAGSGADPKAGQAAFRQHCATCHGPDARGGDLGQTLALNPSLRDPVAFAGLLHEGRNRMPSLRLVLDDRAAADLRAWLLRLDDRTPARDR